MSERRGALLRLSQGSYEKAIVARNTKNRVLAMDLDGYFEEIFLAFFKADKDGEFSLSDRHTIIDIAVTAGGGAVGQLRAESGFLRRVHRLIRRRGIVAIQANDPYLSGLNALILSRITGVPYVIEVVSNYDLSFEVAGKRTMPYFRTREAEKRVERLVLRNASMVYGQNHYYRDYALRNGASAGRSGVVPAVTDPFFYDAKPVKPLSEYVDTRGNRTLLYIGRLSGEKYPLDLIECLARVRGAGEAAMLLIAGDGDMRAEVAARAESLGLRPFVEFLGNRSAQELVDVMHGADVMLATHAGYALIEEALSATPIVAYDYEWHPELIQPERTGLLAPYRDHAAMADQVLRILRDPSFGLAMGAAAQQFALDRHSHARAKAAEREIYQRIL